MLVAHHLFRKLCPLIALGLGVCLIHKQRRQMRCRMRRMEHRQDEILQTLREIRDELKTRNQQPR